MGAVQFVILKRFILDGFGLSVEFVPGSIIYKDIIASTVEVVGHF